MNNKLLINGKCYIVVREWTDFEDDDSNYTEIESVFSNFFEAKKKVIDLIVEEIDSDMIYDTQFGTTDFDLRNILKNINEYRAFYLKQQYGLGKTCIRIVEKVVE